MTNKEKFLALVTEDDFDTMKWAKERKANRNLRRAAQKISILILKRLKELGWSQKELAGKMGVSPQLVNKWVKGKENNFSLEILLRIGDCLEINLIEIPLNNSGVEISGKAFESTQTYEKSTAVDVCKVIPLSNRTTGAINYQ